LTLPSSLSSSPRNSIVAWHHAISSALYAFAPIDGKRHRSLKSTGRSKRVWNHALSVWATSGCARSSSSDKKMSRSAACAQRLVLMFAASNFRAAIGMEFKLSTSQCMNSCGSIVGSGAVAVAAAGACGAASSSAAAGAKTFGVNGAALASAISSSLKFHTQSHPIMNLRSSATNFRKLSASSRGLITEAGLYARLQF
jgi:hypothetical protein